MFAIYQADYSITQNLEFFPYCEVIQRIEVQQVNESITKIKGK